MATRLTHTEFLTRISKINPDIEVLDEYINGSLKIHCKCKIDNHEWNPVGESLLGGFGCPVCANRVVKLGVNDLWSTNPEIATLLANPDEGYLYTAGSHIRTDWKCSICNSMIRGRIIYNVTRHGLSCPQCNDGVSYPNKLMGNVLTQLNINYITEYSPDWLKSKRYDFYFVYNGYSYIIEMDGGFHFHNTKRSSYQEICKIDKFKEDKARENGICLIRIDCEKSNFNYIVKQIKTSKISQIFDLSLIDWKQCHKNASSSNKLKACSMWSTYQNIEQIAQLLHASRAAVYNWISDGAKYGLCDYNAAIVKERAMKKNYDKFSKPIKCIETGIIFPSITAAAKSVGLTSGSSISGYLRGKWPSAGKLPDGTKLHWMYIKQQ